jgi:hypothetical protein
LRCYKPPKTTQLDSFAAAGLFANETLPKLYFDESQLGASWGSKISPTNSIDQIFQAKRHSDNMDIAASGSTSYISGVNHRWFYVAGVKKVVSLTGQDEGRALLTETVS